MPLRHWAQNRNIVLTKTSGDNYKANGRCEAELGVVKRSIRTVLSAGGFSLTWWPLIAKHVRERRLRAQLRSFGYSVGDLLRFGTKAYALRASSLRSMDRCLQHFDNHQLFVQAVETGRYFFLLTTSSLRTLRARMMQSWPIQLKINQLQQQGLRNHF